MNVAPPSVAARRPLPKALVVLMVFFALFGLAAIGVTGYFRLSPDANALRVIALQSAGGSWHQVIALHVGWFTTAALRTGLGFVKMEPEARAALKAVRGAEVGVYQLQAGLAKRDHRNMLARADLQMLARGWNRAVTVSKANELVVVYLSSSRFLSNHLKCCVLVLQDQQLIVVSARANLEPVLSLARQHLANDVGFRPVLALR